MIVINNEKKTTRITVCNYDTYQTKRNNLDRSSTPNNKIVSKDTIIKRKESFKNDLSIYIEKYGKEMLNEFYKYWVELNQQKTRMRFELEKTWELNLRLANWKNNKRQPFKQQKNYSSEQPLISDN